MLAAHALLCPSLSVPCHLSNVLRLSILLAMVEFVGIVSLRCGGKHKEKKMEGGSKRVAELPVSHAVAQPDWLNALYKESCQQSALS